MEAIRGVRLRKFKLRKIILGVRMHFRHTLNIISDWAQDWQLGISVNKCSVLNIGKNVFSADYHICNSVLPNYYYYY